jgi:hypothetical protein
MRSVSLAYSFLPSPVPGGADFPSLVGITPQRTCPRALVGGESPVGDSTVALVWPSALMRGESLFRRDDGLEGAMSRPTPDAVRVICTLEQMQIVMWDIGITLRSECRRTVELAYLQLEAIWLAERANWNRKAAQSFGNTGDFGERLIDERMQLHKREQELAQLRAQLFEEHDDLTVAAA